MIPASGPLHRSMKRRTFSSMVQASRRTVPRSSYELSVSVGERYRSDAYLRDPVRVTHVPRVPGVALIDEEVRTADVIADQLCVVVPVGRVSGRSVQLVQGESAREVEPTGVT